MRCEQVATLEGLTHGYHGRMLFQDVNLEIEKGDRVAILGPNGAGERCCIAATAALVGAPLGWACGRAHGGGVTWRVGVLGALVAAAAAAPAGKSTRLRLLTDAGLLCFALPPFPAGKSTLLRLLMGRESAMAGRVQLGEHGITPNYFEQNQAEALDLELTVLETLVQVRAVFGGGGGEWRMEGREAGCAWDVGAGGGGTKATASTAHGASYGSLDEGQGPAAALWAHVCVLEPWR